MQPYPLTFGTYLFQRRCNSTVPGRREWATPTRSTHSPAPGKPSESTSEDYKKVKFGFNFCFCIQY